MQATRPRRSGFRRCQAPHCRVSRLKVVWPSEYRIDVPVWGRVHLACRPSPYQWRMLRMTAALRRVTISFVASMEPMRQAITSIQRAMATIPPSRADLWELDEAQRVTFEEDNDRP